MIDIQQCWDQLSEKVRQKIAESHIGIPQSSLPKALTDPAYWCSYTRRLSEEERKVLNWFAIERGEDWLAFRELKGNRLPLPSPDFRLILTRLRQRGIVYAVRESWGETFYVLPTDIREAWLAVEWGMDHTPFSKEEAHVNVTQPAAPGIMHDLFHFLVMIERDDVVFTDNGRLHRRAMQKMNVELNMVETSFQKAVWMQGDGEDLSTVHVVHRLAEEYGFLLGKAGEQVSLDQEVLSKWLAMSHQEAEHELYELVIRALLRVKPRYAACLLWMEQQKDWVFVRDMALFWIEQLGQAKTSWRTFATEWTDLCLEPFHALGWIDWGEGISGKAWRWSSFSPFGKTVPMLDKGYVQPNFEWLIPLRFPLALRWKAAQFADLVQTDQMCTYDINESSVKRGIKKGWDAEEMLRFMHDHSLNPVPQNVEASIRQWERQKGRVRLERVFILSCQDESLAQELQQHAGYRSAIKRSLGEKDFLIEERQAERLYALLNEAGYNPLTTERFHKQQAPSPTARRERKEKRFRVESRYPEWEEAIPGLANLPKLWTSSMREYHPSTLKQIVQRALEMQLELEWCREKANERQILRPTRLVNEDGEWWVEGVGTDDRRCRIQLAHMRQVRICIPELAD